MLKENFKNVNFMSATSDIRSRRNKSFIAVSVHYYEPKTLELKSSFIACQHFPGRHTNDKVAEMLKSIFDRFDILAKVFFITTDGAGEYTAALKYYGNNYRSMKDCLIERDDWLFSGSGVDPANDATQNEENGDDGDQADVFESEFYLVDDDDDDDELHSILGEHGSGNDYSWSQCWKI